MTYVEEYRWASDPRAMDIHLREQADAILTLQQLGIIDAATAARLDEVGHDVLNETIGQYVAAALGLEDVDWLSGRQLSTDDKNDLLGRFPDAVFVNEAQRGQTRTDEPVPLPVPIPPLALSADQEAMVERHVRYWTEFEEWNEDAPLGYWMIERYERVLPRPFRYLGGQVLRLDYTPARNEELREVLRAIIGLARPDVEWEPFLHGF